MLPKEQFRQIFTIRKSKGDQELKTIQFSHPAITNFHDISEA